MFDLPKLDHTLANGAQLSLASALSATGAELSMTAHMEGNPSSEQPWAKNFFYIGEPYVAYDSYRKPAFTLGAMSYVTLTLTIDAETHAGNVPASGPGMALSSVDWSFSMIGRPGPAETGDEVNDRISLSIDGHTRNHDSFTATRSYTLFNPTQDAISVALSMNGQVFVKAVPEADAWALALAGLGMTMGLSFSCRARRDGRRAQAAR